jgi:hypothetical protein
MDLVVPAGGALTQDRADRSVRPPSEKGRALIDLKGTTFVDPFGLVAVAGILDDAAGRGDEVEVVRPDSSDVAMYLSRMRLADAIDAAGGECALPAVRERRTGDRLLELGRFDSADAAEDLAARVHQIFRREDPDAARALFRCVTEAAVNVCEHSGKGHGWAALQQYTYQGHTVVSFAVGDSGIGLRRSLQKRHDVEDDDEAVRLAVKRGITSTDEPNRGLGLSGIVLQARARNGAVRLWSGKATGLTGPAPGRLNVRPTQSRFPGTLAHARLRRA